MLLNRVSLPRKGGRVGLRIVLFEACSAFTRVTARTLALPPIRGTLTRRLQTFRHLHACSGCFRLERLPGGPCTHWKAPPCHGAHPERKFAPRESHLKSDGHLTRLCINPFFDGRVARSRGAVDGAFMVVVSSSGALGCSALDLERAPGVNALL